MGNEAEGLFKINKDTGELMLGAVLDREKDVRNSLLSNMLGIAFHNLIMDLSILKFPTIFQMKWESHQTEISSHIAFFVK